MSNIAELYQAGRSLSGVLELPYFRRIREWQTGYLKDGGEVQNLFRPCPMRDHRAFAHQTVREFGARPMDEEAARELADPEYHRRMVEYNEEVGRLLDPLWQQEIYCRGCEEEGAEAAASG